jgi:hypothetical protein
VWLAGVLAGGCGDDVESCPDTVDDALMEAGLDVGERVDCGSLSLYDDKMQAIACLTSSRDEGRVAAFVVNESDDSRLPVTYIGVRDGGVLRVSISLEDRYADYVETTVSSCSEVLDGSPDGVPRCEDRELLYDCYIGPEMD